MVNGIDPRDHHLHEAALVPSGQVVRLAGIDDPLREYGHYVSAGLKNWLRTRRGGRAVREVKGVSRGQRDPVGSSRRPRPGADSAHRHPFARR
jgi:hypothetical protein